jgi:hypothetical protein
VEEVPLSQDPLLVFDERQTLAREDEEVLLRRLGVVQAAWTAGLEHGERDPEVRKALLLELGAVV